ncbi:ABC transporter family substrate-binding protein [Pseudonocardia acaciae]|uniref:ABC transporter family substrate-binding protein n=1 Tax=Pseudonocardia acaciae TaxID=551276 RepID=UPI0004901464|nr:ABC transporter family substrate-binding protein [Pseudonocardia acaciae]
MNAVRLAAVLASAALLTGCSLLPGADDEPARPVLNAGRADLNAKDPSGLKDGGELRWPIEGVPPTFNIYQTNGPSDDNRAIVDAMMPRAFRSTPNGSLLPDRNYLVSAGLLPTAAPQTVVYTIQPNASWNDGAPITWRDFESQWKALTGSNPAFQSTIPEGYDEIAGVTRGVDDKHAVVTFKGDYGEWQSLFSPLYPASTTGNPVLFNTGWLRKAPATAGPFKLQSVDPVTGVTTLVRDEAWWGPRAKLDRIVFKPYLPAKLADGLLGNDIDFYQIGENVDLVRRARTMPDVVVRQSVDRDYDELLINGGPGAALADLRLRQAIAEGIDRTAVARQVVGEIAPAIRQHGNHLYAFGSSSYRDNSGVVPYDQARAGQDLDALGWTLRGDRRVNARGTALALRLVVEAGNPASEAVGAAVRDQLAKIGVTVTVQPMAGPEKSLATRAGNFDLIHVRSRHSASPLRSSIGRYYQPSGQDVAQNYGRIFNPTIADQIAEDMGKTDDIERAAAGDGVDQVIWTVVHSLPLYPDPGAYAVRSTLANFGAPGLSDLDYTAVGFTK